MRRRELLEEIGLLSGGLSLGGTLAVPASGDGPEFRAPEAVLVDERIAVGVRGLPSEKRVTVEARTRIEPQSRYENEVRTWSSSATFRSSEEGTLSLADNAPIEGDYDGVDPMGLFWSMTTDRSPSEAFFPHTDHRVTLTASVDDERVAETTVSRRFAAEGVTGRELDDDDLAGTVYTPPGDGPAPGVVLTHGSNPDEPTAAAKLLASRGFATLTLQYFGTDDGSVPRYLSEVPLEYVRDAIGAFLDHDRVAGPGVGFHGPSKGGELAMLVAAHDDRVDAVVGEVPSDLVWEGFDRNGNSTGTSSWSLDGDPLPYVETADDDQIGPDDDPRAYYEIGERQASPEEIAAAEIPVETIDSPALLLSAEDDRLWHSTEMADRIVDRLSEHDHPHEFEHRSFEGAGHWMRLPHLPTYGASNVVYELGGTPATNARAGRESWRAIREFFADHAGTDVDPATVGSKVRPITESVFERYRVPVVGAGGLAAVGGLALLVYKVRQADPAQGDDQELTDKLERKDLLEGGEPNNVLEWIIQLADEPRTYVVAVVSSLVLTGVFLAVGNFTAGVLLLFLLTWFLVETWLRFGVPRLERRLEQYQSDEPASGSLKFAGPSTDFQVLLVQLVIVFLVILGLILLGKIV